jgi:glycosyltransferase involved in cell wall biosynthesis
MRILVIHSPYLSGPVSGENRVVADEIELLRSGGHDVTEFIPERVTKRGPLRSLREASTAIWSYSAARHVEDAVRHRRADVVHCHNLFPALSPAVVRAASRGGAAVVLTLHNYRLLCLPATFLRNGEICEDCLGRAPWRGVLRRCYRNSMGASAVLATSLTLHGALQTLDDVDVHLAVSDFVRDKHIEAGFVRHNVLTKPNFAWEIPRREGPGEHFLFAGRLSVEKDVGTVLDAWRCVPSRLIVVGDGPSSRTLRGRSPEGVTFRGTVPPAEIGVLLRRARALLLPSLSYEGAPRVVLEAYAAGVPVIANDLGALRELVIHGTSGLLVRPRNPAAIVAAVTRLADDAESIRLGRGAWTVWRDRYSPQQALRELETAYRLAIHKRALRSGALADPPSPKQAPHPEDHL